MIETRFYPVLGTDENGDETLSYSATVKDGYDQVIRFRDGFSHSRFAIAWLDEQVRDLRMKAIR